LADGSASGRATTKGARTAFLLAHANRRLPGERAGCGPLSARFRLPVARQRQGGDPVGQARGAPNLFARFDAAKYRDPAFASRRSAHGGFGQAQQILRDFFGGKHVFHPVCNYSARIAPTPAVLRTLQY